MRKAGNDMTAKTSRAIWNVLLTDLTPLGIIIIVLISASLLAAGYIFVPMAVHSFVPGLEKLGKQWCEFESYLYKVSLAHLGVTTFIAVAAAGATFWWGTIRCLSNSAGRFHRIVLCFGPVCYVTLALPPLGVAASRAPGADGVLSLVTLVSCGALVLIALVEGLVGRGKKR